MQQWSSSAPPSRSSRLMAMRPQRTHSKHHRARGASTARHLLGGSTARQLHRDPTADASEHIVFLQLSGPQLRGEMQGAEASWRSRHIPASTPAEVTAPRSCIYTSRSSSTRVRKHGQPRPSTTDVSKSKAQRYRESIHTQSGGPRPAAHRASHPWWRSLGSGVVGALALGEAIEQKHKEKKRRRRRRRIERGERSRREGPRVGDDRSGEEKSARGSRSRRHEGGEERYLGPRPVG